MRLGHKSVVRVLPVKLVFIIKHMDEGVTRYKSVTEVFIIRHIDRGVMQGNSWSCCSLQEAATACVVITARQH